MKDVKSTLLDRRSIRRYEREAISSDNMNFIYEAIRNTPTSYNGQQFSVIDVTDQTLKEKLYEITGQKQIKTCSHFMLFCADYNKISILAEDKGVDMPEFAKTADGVIVGVVDATLAMMSAVVAAESLGLGTCPIGYARTAAPEEMAMLMKLPQQVFVVCGLAIGVPRELPDLKPKQPKQLVIFNNEYRQEGLLPDLQEYDAVVTHYNKVRSGQTSNNDWCEHIVDYYHEAMLYHTLDAMRRRGFDVKR
ncbi:MAG: nitroreductase family protein [Muribaculum sp.]|nr:nitroreductase family protein [Muribaculaceae bacterium]MCM1081343.1 nitroreductase family protein [Muribaculum sp.]